MKIWFKLNDILDMLLLGSYEDMKRYGVDLKKVPGIIDALKKGKWELAAN